MSSERCAVSLQQDISILDFQVLICAKKGLCRLPFLVRPAPCNHFCKVCKFSWARLPTLMPSLVASFALCDQKVVGKANDAGHLLAQISVRLSFAVTWMRLGNVRLCSARGDKLLSPCHRLPSTKKIFRRAQRSCQGGFCVPCIRSAACWREPAARFGKQQKPLFVAPVTELDPVVER